MKIVVRKVHTHFLHLRKSNHKIENSTCRQENGNPYIGTLCGNDYSYDKY